MSQGETLREGERRFVTVLFADMKGFTSLSQRMDPEEMDDLMSRIFSGFEEIVHQHEGTVEKYIGDAMVAVFGVPEIHEDDPARAVNAALDLLERPHHSGAPTDRADLGFRIGIHTGLITTGKRGQYDVVTGHAMAVAARLQAAAPMNGVYVSEETHDKCVEEFFFAQPETLHLKGRDEEIRAFLVKGKRSQPFTEESVFVDREGETETLLRAYLRHDPARAGGFFIVGAAGIGKTRLAARFLEKVQELPDFSVPILRARARKYRRRNFAVVTDLLVNYFGLSSEESRESTIEKTRALDGVDQAIARSFCEILFDIGTLEDSARVFPTLYHLVRQILQAHRSDPYSVVIFVDNNESIDRESRSFFRYLLRDEGPKPFFLLCDREVDPYLQETFAGLETIRLGPLAHRASSDLLRRLRPESEAEGIIEQVLSNAGGNPLFIREYAKLAKNGAANGERDSVLPTTIQNIFLSTVQRFPRESRELLRKLAVFVHSFTLADAEYLQERADAKPEIARQAIGDFVRADILIHEDSIYLFKHEVFKQALYNSILNHNKRILHKVIADRMRAFANPHTGRLLHHLSRAEEWDDVRSLLQDAPDGAYNRDYLVFYDALLENIDAEDHAARTYLLFRKCTILFNNGNSERADSILKDILRVATTHRLAGAAANAYHILTAYNSKAYALQKAYFCGRKALYYYEQLPDTVQARRNVLKLLSQAELLRNRHEQSHSFVRELDELCPRADAEQISAYGERSILSGEYARAQEILRDVIDDDSAELENYRLGHLFLALMASWFACDFESVTRVSDRLFRGKHRHYGYRAQAIAQAAGARFLLGNPEDVADRIQQAEFETYQIRNDFDQVDALRTIAEVCLIIGHVDRAEQTAQEGLAIGLRHSAYFPTFTLLLLLVEINVRRGDRESASFFLEEAAFLVELQPLLRNRDLILFHYFAAETRFDATPQEHRARAREHLETERRNIGNGALFQNFLRLRCFGEIAHEIEGQAPLPST